MKIFILEDDPRRMNFFNKTFFNDEVIWMTEAADAIEYLKNHFYDMDNIFLDHDLGGMTFVSSDEYNTGYTVAKFISENFEGPFEHVIIHSMNPPAADRMQDLLEESHTIPFHILYERIGVK